MKFLIAGFGSIGRRHFHNLKALGESDFVFYRSNFSTLSDDEIADYPVETNLEAALGHQPDVVIVSNPTALHLDVAIPAAEYGCHLFLEKPIFHSMEGINQLEEVVAKTGVKVLVGFQFRYHPQLEKIRKLLAKEVIGEVISVRVEWGEYLPDWHPWEDYRKGYSARADLGGGVVLTLSHPLDYLYWLFGKVESLWALTQKVDKLEIDVDAVAEIGLRFTGGVLGNVHLDYLQRPNTHFLRVIGSDGKIDWDYHQGSLLVFNRSENSTESFPLPVDFERNQMFIDQMTHLIELVQNGIEARCSLKDGIFIQKLIMGIHTSADNGNIFRM